MTAAYPLLFRKEWSTCFRTPAAAVAAVAFLLPFGAAVLLRFSDFARLASPSAPFWSDPHPVLFLALLLSSTLLTMHLFASEQLSGSLDLLRAAPVSESRIVLAKFSAAALLSLVLWIPLFLVPLLLPPLGLSAAVPLLRENALFFFFAAWLLQLFFLSAGLLASLLIPRPLPAAMAALALLAALLAPDFLPDASPLPSPFSPVLFLRDAGSGVFDTRPASLCLGSSALLLFAATRILQARRWN